MTLETEDRLFFSPGVFAALSHTEEEGVRVGLAGPGGCGFQLSCREATKDEILLRLYYSQRPSLVITTPMEILNIPPISSSIKNPLESGIGILVSDEFNNHIPMVCAPKCLGISKIFYRVFLRDRYLGCFLLSFKFFRNS